MSSRWFTEIATITAHDPKEFSDKVNQFLKIRPVDKSLYEIIPESNGSILYVAVFEYVGGSITFKEEMELKEESE